MVQHGVVVPCGRNHGEPLPPESFLHAPFISITGGCFNNPPISGGLKSPSVLSCGSLVTDPPRGDPEAQVRSVCRSVSSQRTEPRQRKWIVPSVQNECVVYLLAFITVCCPVLLCFGSSASSRRESYGALAAYLPTHPSVSRR